MTCHAGRGEWIGTAVAPPRAVSASRRQNGRLAWQSGHLAEDSVAGHLEAQGLSILARRWRGRAGEVDLIARDGDCVVFVEVKKAATHDAAALRLRRSQMDRICAAACEFCETLPTGQLTEMRLDVALVDAQGRIALLQNAFTEA